MGTPNLFKDGQDGASVPVFEFQICMKQENSLGQVRKGTAW